MKMGQNVFEINEKQKSSRGISKQTHYEDVVRLVFVTFAASVTGKKKVEHS